MPRLAERFFSKVLLPENRDDCWLWTAGKTDKGYGRIMGERQKVQLAHRLSYLLHVGPIPDALYVLHECDTPACVNPAHLFLGTNIENIEDRDKKGRVAKGERHCCAKLTEEKVRLIRRSPLSTRRLAAEFGIDGSTVHSARAGKTWRHVE